MYSSSSSSCDDITININNNITPSPPPPHLPHDFPPLTTVLVTTLPYHTIHVCNRMGLIVADCFHRLHGEEEHHSYRHRDRLQPIPHRRVGVSSWYQHGGRTEGLQHRDQGIIGLLREAVRHLRSPSCSCGLPVPVSGVHPLPAVGSQLCGSHSTVEIPSLYICW